jgi:hypothetical protein
VLSKNIKTEVSLIGSLVHRFLHILLTKYFRIFQTKYTRPNSKNCGGKMAKVIPSSLFDSGREKEEVYIASTFGICAGLLRQREFSKGGFIRSSCFDEIISSMNAIELEKCSGDHDHEPIVNGNNIEVTPNTHVTDSFRVFFVQKELKFLSLLHLLL